jgi:hypothetical protein
MVLIALEWGIDDDELRAWTDNKGRAISALPLLDNRKNSWLLLYFVKMVLILAASVRSRSFPPAIFPLRLMEIS